MINCLIVEDEPLAAEILQDYVHQVPFMKLKGVSVDAIYALETLQKEQIDLLFLDIHLPGLKGLDFLKSLKNPPAVILTTAYHEYAIQGYELNVVDYLLKPIEFQRFLAAVNKVNQSKSIPIRQSLTIQTERKKVVIPISEIIYIESQKEYIKIQTASQTYTTKYGLTRIEEELMADQFLRVHRSFIVAVSRIKAYSGHEVELAGYIIPIGGNYKEIVGSRLEKLFR